MFLFKSRISKISKFGSFDLVNWLLKDFTNNVISSFKTFIYRVFNNITTPWPAVQITLDVRVGTYYIVCIRIIIITLFRRVRQRVPTRFTLSSKTIHRRTCRTHVGLLYLPTCVHDITLAVYAQQLYTYCSHHRETYKSCYTRECRGDL